MNFIAISDLHGHLISIDGEADVLLIAGDTVPLNCQGNSVMSKLWIKDKFIPWCMSLKVDKIILIGGNHDLWFERFPTDLCKLLPEKINYLENNSITLEKEGQKYYIFGTPLCKPFGHWSFMYPLENQREMFNAAASIIPENVDKKIVLSHDSPYGVSDVLLDKTCPWYSEDHLGNPELTRFIKTIKPDYVIHGHLHSTNHEIEQLGDTKIVCTSILGEDYKEQYEPFRFSL